MIRRHELLENDFQRRLNYSQWFLGQCQEEQFLQNLIIGDEAIFCINGYVNTRNTREYAPEFFYDQRSSREKINVWAAVCGDGTILVPYFTYLPLM